MPSFLDQFMPPDLEGQMGKLAELLASIADDIHALRLSETTPKEARVEPEPEWLVIPSAGTLAISSQRFNAHALVISSDIAGKFGLVIGSSVKFWFRLPASTVRVINVSEMGVISLGRGVDVSIDKSANAAAVVDAYLLGYPS